MNDHDDGLVIDREYEPDDEAIARAVAILLREEATEEEGRAA